MTTRAKRTAKPRQIEALIGSDHELLKGLLKESPLHGVSWAQFPRFGGTMRHADSSPSIPPRFVAFARRYHPSTCGFAPSDARCCVHDLGRGEPVPAPPAVFTMETTRPPGFPGNPPARMPRAPTPARAPPPRPLRCGEIAFRPTHDVGPHKQCMSGLNHAAYGLPVNASRPETRGGTDTFMHNRSPSSELSWKRYNRSHPDQSSVETRGCIGPGRIAALVPQPKQIL